MFRRFWTTVGPKTCRGAVVVSGAPCLCDNCGAERCCFFFFSTSAWELVGFGCVFFFKGGWGVLQVFTYIYIFLGGGGRFCRALGTGTVFCFRFVFFLVGGGVKRCQTGPLCFKKKKIIIIRSILKESPEAFGASSKVFDMC